LVNRYRQEQQFYSKLASLQPEDSDERRQAFKNYKKACFPYIHKTATDTRKRVQSILDRAFSQGPVVITALSEEEKYNV
jgi:hypothetical protein